MTKVELEIITDPDMLYSFKKVQEAEFLVSNRYSKANDKYLKSYGPKQKPKHIIYLDANNIYGYM